MKTKIILNTTGGLLSLFGIITLIASTAVIFDLFGMREKEGNYVLFVVMLNLICAVLYLIAAYSIFKRKAGAIIILYLSVILLILTFVALVIYIYAGGIYENKTIYALIFRIFISLIFLFITSKYLSKKPLEN